MFDLATICGAALRPVRQSPVGFSPGNPSLTQNWVRSYKMIPMLAPEIQWVRFFKSPIRHQEAAALLHTLPVLPINPRSFAGHLASFRQRPASLFRPSPDPLMQKLGSFFQSAMWQGREALSARSYPQTTIQTPYAKLASFRQNLLQPTRRHASTSSSPRPNLFATTPPGIGVRLALTLTAVKQ